MRSTYSPLVSATLAEAVRIVISDWNVVLVTMSASCRAGRRFFSSSKPLGTVSSGLVAPGSPVWNLS